MQLSCPDAAYLFQYTRSLPRLYCRISESVPFTRQCQQLCAYQGTSEKLPSQSPLA